MSGVVTCLAVGESVEFTKALSAADSASFAEISGDHDPVPTDSAYARSTAFGNHDPSLRMGDSEPRLVLPRDVRAASPLSSNSPSLPESRLVA